MVINKKMNYVAIFGLELEWSDDLITVNSVNGDLVDTFTFNGKSDDEIQEIEDKLDEYYQNPSEFKITMETNALPGILFDSKARNNYFKGCWVLNETGLFTDETKLPSIEDMKFLISAAELSKTKFSLDVSRYFVHV